MNCTSTHVIPSGLGNGQTVICQLRDGHGGTHLKTFLFRDTVQWRDKPETNPNDCGAIHYFGDSGEEVTCRRVKGHATGPDANLHYGYDKQGNYRSWRPAGAGFSVGGYEPAGTVHPAESYGRSWAYVSGRGYGKTAFAEELKRDLVGAAERLHEVMKEKETPVPLELTVEELKAIAYAISGETWKEDEPELVEKIDAALKAAL